MSATYAGHKRLDDDHFHPEAAEDPAAQRRIRGWLEQIDYTAFACSREVVGKAIGGATPASFQALALATAHARAAWVAEAFRASGVGGGVDGAGVKRLAELREAFEELSRAYEAVRRMVERGYLSLDAAAPA